MSRRAATWWRGLSLAGQYMLASSMVLVLVMAGVGWWIAREVAAGVEHRTAETTAMYVESFVAPILHDAEVYGRLDPQQTVALNRLLSETPLGQGIVTFKIWNLDGRVLFSTEPEVAGTTFPVHPRLAAAARGEVVSEISALEEEENIPERGRWSRLLETYSPVRNATGSIVAVAEFYETVDDLEEDIARIQRRSWLVVAAATVATYLLLAGLVKRGSDTIRSQQRTVAATIEHLTHLLAQNETLHERVRGAASRSTALNERYLRRVSAELHDGPVQEVSVALLRLGGTADGGPATVEACLRRALDELRGIAAGLRLPELEGLTLAKTVERVVSVHTRRTGVRVQLELGAVPGTVALPLKITVYRLIQEALANGFRHGGGVNQRVRVTSDDWSVCVYVSDDGPGLTTAVDDGDHLGLAVMRERVESLGGAFRLVSGVGRGVTVEVHLPRDAMSRPEVEVRAWSESA